MHIRLRTVRDVGLSYRKLDKEQRVPKNLMGLRNISDGWKIFQRVAKRFRGYDEYFGGYYKTERGLKNFGGVREWKEKARRGREG